MRNRQVKVSIGRQVIGYVAGETAAYVEIMPISVVPYDAARSATRRDDRSIVLRHHDGSSGCSVGEPTLRH